MFDSAMTLPASTGTSASLIESLLRRPRLQCIKAFGDIPETILEPAVGGSIAEAGLAHEV